MQVTTRCPTLLLHGAATGLEKLIRCSACVQAVGGCGRGRQQEAGCCKAQLLPGCGDEEHGPPLGHWRPANTGVRACVRARDRGSLRCSS